MDILQARQLAALIPRAQQAALAAAHERYMYFAGEYTDQPAVDHIAEDRAAFPHLLAFTADGRQQMVRGKSGMQPPTHWIPATTDRMRNDIASISSSVATVGELRALLANIGDDVPMTMVGDPALSRFLLHSAADKHFLVEVERGEEPDEGCFRDMPC